MNKVEAKAAQWKKDEVNLIKNLVSNYKLIGLVDMEGLPASQLLKLKSGLREVAELKMARTNLLKRALQEIKKPNMEAVIENVKGEAALLFTNEDAFKIFKRLKKNIAYTKAKAGQVAPFDIVIKAGLTSFMAGPMIGELGRFGLKTGVEAGKIAIKEDKVLVKKGDVIKSDQADLMTKFGMEPMEIGLKLTFTYCDGEILSREVLDIDETEVINSLVNLSRDALYLGVEIGYLTDETVNLLIGKAHRIANNVAKKLGVMTDENTGEVLGDVEKSALLLKEKTGYEPTSVVENLEIKPELLKEVKIEQIKEVKKEANVEEKEPFLEKASGKNEEEKTVKNAEVDTKSITRITENVETLIEEEAKNAVNINQSKIVENVSKKVSEIIGGKSLNTNPMDVKNTGLKNQANVNFDRDAQVAAGFLRRATDMKIKSQTKR